MRLADRKIIVTGGPTREWLDPVRYISNASSGRMGVALADEAHRRGLNTVFIHGPVEQAIISDKSYHLIGVESTADMLDAVLHEMGNNAVLVMSAAPADYAPAERSGIKIKKTDSELVLRLVKNPDILMHIARKRVRGELNNIFVAGFAAETTNVESYARKKLIEKNLDMICLNDVSRAGAGFGVSTNIITIFTRDGGYYPLPLMSKEDVAASIIDHIEKLLP